MNAFCLRRIFSNQAEMVVAATVKVGYGRGETARRRRKEREHESYRTNVPFGLGNVGIKLGMLYSATQTTQWMKAEIGMQ